MPPSITQTVAGLAAAYFVGSWTKSFLSGLLGSEQEAMLSERTLDDLAEEDREVRAWMEGAYERRRARKAPNTGIPYSSGSYEARETSTSSRPEWNTAQGYSSSSSLPVRSDNPLDRLIREIEDGAQRHREGIDALIAFRESHGLLTHEEKEALERERDDFAENANVMKRRFQDRRAEQIQQKNVSLHAGRDPHVDTSVNVTGYHQSSKDTWRTSSVDTSSYDHTAPPPYSLNSSTSASTKPIYTCCIPPWVEDFEDDWAEDDWMEDDSEEDDEPRGWNKNDTAYTGSNTASPQPSSLYYGRHDTHTNSRTSDPSDPIDEVSEEMERKLDDIDRRFGRIEYDRPLTFEEKESERTQKEYVMQEALEQRRRLRLEQQETQGTPLMYAGAPHIPSTSTVGSGNPVDTSHGASQAGSDGSHASITLRIRELHRKMQVQSQTINSQTPAVPRLNSSVSDSTSSKLSPGTFQLRSEEDRVAKERPRLQLESLAARNARTSSQTVSPEESRVYPATSTGAKSKPVSTSTRRDEDPAANIDNNVWQWNASLRQYLLVRDPSRISHSRGSGSNTLAGPASRSSSSGGHELSHTDSSTGDTQTLDAYLRRKSSSATPKPEIPFNPPTSAPATRQPAYTPPRTVQATNQDERAAKAARAKELLQRRRASDKISSTHQYPNTPSVATETVRNAKSLNPTAEEFQSRRYLIPAKRESGSAANDNKPTSRTFSSLKELKSTSNKDMGFQRIVQNADSTAAAETGNNKTISEPSTALGRSSVGRSLYIPPAKRISGQDKLSPQQPVMTVNELTQDFNTTSHVGPLHASVITSDSNMTVNNVPPPKAMPSSNSNMGLHPRPEASVSVIPPIATPHFDDLDSHYVLVLEAAQATVTALDKIGIKCALFGSLAANLYGAERIPKDVDLLTFPTPENSMDSEQIKHHIVSLDSRFYLKKSANPKNTYRILWFNSATGKARNEFTSNEGDCKVDILIPGIMGLPDLAGEDDTVRWLMPDPTPYSTSDTNMSLPVLPFPIVLLHKLQGWSDHRVAREHFKRKRQGQDAADVASLLSIHSETDNLASHMSYASPSHHNPNLWIPALTALWMNPTWFPVQFQMASKRRVRLFCYYFPEWKSHWKRLGFETEPREGEVEKEKKQVLSVGGDPVDTS